MSQCWTCSLGALALSPPAEVAVRYRGLVAQARKVLPRVVRVREAVAQVGELRAVLRDGRPAGLPGASASTGPSPSASPR